MAIKPKVFIGSASESLAIAYAIQNNLQYDCEVTVWTQGVFSLSSSSLEDLVNALEHFDFGIFVLTNDDVTKMRDVSVSTPRDNVIFELGLFIGRLGRRRSFMVVPRGISDLHLPSDLLGIGRADYDPARRDLDAALGPASNRIRIGITTQGLFANQVLPRIPQLDQLQRLNNVYNLNTFVGKWETIQIEGIHHLAQQSNVDQIDVLSVYRVGEIRRTLDAFRNRENAHLRVCFANMWDLELANAYKRKFHDREIDHMQRAVQDSLSGLIGPFKLEVINSKVTVRNVQNPPLAQYDIRLTSQRNTFGYYRIDDISFLVPLDMKRSQNPPPLAWVIHHETATPIFDFYLREFESMFNEALPIYNSRE